MDYSVHNLKVVMKSQHSITTRLQVYLFGKVSLGFFVVSTVRILTVFLHVCKIPLYGKESLHVQESFCRKVICKYNLSAYCRTRLHLGRQIEQNELYISPLIMNDLNPEKVLSQKYGLSLVNLSKLSLIKRELKNSL